MNPYTEIKSRILNQPEEWVFSVWNFKDLGDEDTNSAILDQLSEESLIRALEPEGLFCRIRKHPHFGILNPPIDSIAKAFAEREGYRLMPTGATAANLLGISTQVPARAAYLTDGPERTILFRNIEIQFRHTDPKYLDLQNRISGLIIQALLWIGREHVGQQHVDLLKRKLPNDAKSELLEDIQVAPDWMKRWIDEISKIA